MAIAKKTKKKTIKKHPGINQTTGRLKKGWKYPQGGGKPVKVEAPKKKTARGLKSPVKTTRSGSKLICARQNTDGTTTIYSAQSDNPSTACPMGGKLTTLNQMAITSGLAGAKPKRKRAATRKPAAKKKR